MVLSILCHQCNGKIISKEGNNILLLELRNSLKRIGRRDRESFCAGGHLTCYEKSFLPILETFFPKYSSWTEFELDFEGWNIAWSSYRWTLVMEKCSGSASLTWGSGAAAGLLVVEGSTGAVVLVAMFSVVSSSCVVGAAVGCSSVTLSGFDDGVTDGDGASVEVELPP